MDIIEGFGLCDPEGLCMVVVSANTISRLAVKFWLLFPPSLELHISLTSLFEYNLAKYFFPTKLYNGFIHSGYILFFGTANTDSPLQRVCCCEMGCDEFCYKVYWMIASLIHCNIVVALWQLSVFPQWLFLGKKILRLLVFCQNASGFCWLSQGPQSLPVNESQKKIRQNLMFLVFSYRQEWCDILFKKLSVADTT